MVTHPNNGYLYMIEGDHRVMGEEAATKKISELVSLKLCASAFD